MEPLWLRIIVVRFICLDFASLALSNHYFYVLYYELIILFIQSGLRSGSCQLFATFTPDGQHIVSASEDSNIYVWNHEDQEEASLKHGKTIWSSERFHSNNAAIAIPWNDQKPRNPVSFASQILPPQSDSFWCMSKAVKCSSSRSEDSAINNFVSRFAPGIFNLNQEFSTESTCRSSATWPEEILPSHSIRAILDESQYKFLRNCFQSTSNSWGQVIVTAGWDGKIRSFQNYGLPAHQWSAWAFGESIRQFWHLTWPEEKYPLPSYAGPACGFLVQDITCSVLLLNCTWTSVVHNQPGSPWRSPHQQLFMAWTVDCTYCRKFLA